MNREGAEKRSEGETESNEQRAGSKMTVESTKAKNIWSNVIESWTICKTD